MNVRDSEFDRLLAEWLEDDPFVASAAPVEASVDFARTHPRRRDWLAFLRRDAMTTRTSTGLRPVTLLIAVVALLALAVGGAVFIGSRPDATPTPTATPAASLLSSADGAFVPAGTYRVMSSVPVRLTVPDGWGNVFSGLGVIKHSGERDEYEASVVFWRLSQVTEIYAHPCRWHDNFIDPPVEVTPSGITAALAEQPLRGDGEPQDITISGYSGKMVELSIPRDLDFSTCDENEPQSWLGRSHQGPGQVDEIYVVDVNGLVLVIDASYMPDTPASVRAELDAIVDSIVVE